MIRQHRNRFVMVLVLAGACCAFDGAPAQNEAIPSAPVNYNPVKEAVSEIIKKEMRKDDVTGLSIALVDDQVVVWAQGFGYADKERHIPATPETAYRLGFLTNLFTATAAMQLVEQGKLDLDRPLQQYLPEFSIHTRFSGTAASPITLRHLLTHHSGLPLNIQKGMWCSKPAPFTDVVNLLRDEYAAYPPGYIFSQSNIDMTLLGHVIERVSGRDYISYMNESLLQPIAMTGSAYIPVAPANVSPSKGYNRGREINEPPVRDIPADGLSSSVLDMSRFMQMVLAQGRSHGRQIVKPETLAYMLRSQNDDVPLDLGLRAGLGWMLSGLGEIDIQNAGTVAHHAGSTLVFRGQMILLMEHKLGVVVLANSSTSSRTVNNAAVRALTLALEAKTGIKQPENKKHAEQDAPLTQDVRNAYSGQYASLIGLAVMKPKSDHFHTRFMNRTFQMVPLADGRFGMKYKVLGLFTISLGELDFYELSCSRVAGREILAVSTRGRDILIAEKIHHAPIPEAWMKRLGGYRIDNQGDDFPLIEDIQFRYEDGLLLAECAVPFFFKGTVQFPLNPISDTEAVIAGLGQGLGETIRVVRINGKEALRYSGYLLVKNGD